jgi:hypothetical protein
VVILDLQTRRTHDNPDSSSNAGQMHGQVLVADAILVQMSWAHGEVQVLRATVESPRVVASNVGTWGYLASTRNAARQRETGCFDLNLSMRSKSSACQIGLASFAKGTERQPGQRLEYGCPSCSMLPPPRSPGRITTVGPLPESPYGIPMWPRKSYRIELCRYM